MAETARHYLKRVEAAADVITPLPPVVLDERVPLLGAGEPTSGQTLEWDPQAKAWVPVPSLLGTNALESAVSDVLANSAVVSDAATTAIQTKVSGLNLLAATQTELDEPAQVWTDQNGAESWMGIAGDGGPTLHGISRFVTKAGLYPVAPIDGETDVAFGYVDAAGRRTDLELKDSGQFTDRVAKSLADRNRLPSAYPLSVSTPQDMVSLVPAFKKFVNPIINATVDQGTGSVYWPSVVDVRGKIANPIDNFYMLYSPDHSTDQGGLFLRTAPTPLGPFTPYQATAVYVDTVQGDSTETPWIVWNNETQLFHVYYQNRFAGINQSTLLATSPTLLPGSFTRIGVVIDVENLTDQPGDGHTGYARVQRLAPNNWIAYHTRGGAGVALTGLSRSDDGIEWETDPRSMTPNVDKTGNGSLGTGVVPIRFRWRGIDWCFQAIGPVGVGGLEDFPGQFNSRIAVSRWESLRRPSGAPTPVIEYQNEPGEDVQQGIQWVMASEGKLYLYYKSNGDIFVAVADGLTTAHVPVYAHQGTTSLWEEAVTRRVPMGKASTVIDVDFGFAEAFPTLPGGDPALEVVYGGGTGSVAFEAIQNGGDGRLAVTLPSGGAGKSASLQTPFDVDLSKFIEAEVTIEGYYSGPTDQISVQFGFVGAAAGAYMRAVSANDPVVRYGGGGGVDVGNFSKAILNSQLEYGRKRNLTFLLRIPKKRAYLCMDDQVNGFVEVPSMVAGLARPTLQFITNDALAHTFRLTRFVLILRRN